MATAATVRGQEEHEQIGKAAGPCVMVIFGASGDLTKRKLVPALYNLGKAKLMPKHFAAVGLAFADFSRHQFPVQGAAFRACAARGTASAAWLPPPAHCAPERVPSQPPAATLTPDGHDPPAPSAARAG